MLTPTELRLLECLMRNSEITASQDTLVERIWESDFSRESNLLVIFIQRLRKKIEQEPDPPERIQTVRGIGYVFRASQRAKTVAATEPVLAGTA